MNFGVTETALLLGYAALWWLVYLFLKVRGDRKALISHENPDTPDYRPCQGCIITQSAMIAAAVLCVIYGVVAAEFISFKR